MTEPASTDPPASSAAVVEQDPADQPTAGAHNDPAPGIEAPDDMVLDGVAQTDNGELIGAITDETANEEPPRITKALMIKMGVGLVIMLIAVGIGSVLLRDPIDTFSAWFVGKYGIAGMLSAVFVIDFLPMPWTNEPFVIVGFAGGYGYWQLLPLAAIGSAVGGFCGYLMGAFLNKHTNIDERFVRWQPEAFAWIRSRGVWAIGLAALVPLPYNIFTWVGGIVGLPADKVFLVSLLRIPKTFFYGTLIYFGWGMGG